jgi:hypothetical protein
VLEDIVDGVGVLPRGSIELLLGTLHFILTDFLVLDHPVEGLFGGTASTSDRDPGLLSLVPGELDVFLTPFLGELWQDDPDGVAVVGGIDAEI